MYRFAIISILTLIGMLSPAIAEESAHPHPATNCVPEQLPLDYAKRVIPPSWSQGDITFIAEDEYISPENLSSEEKYMLGGAKMTTLGHPMMAWITQTFIVASAYYDQIGYLPDVLDHNAYAALCGGEVIQSDEFLCLASPVTNHYPKLKSSDFSPGDLYMRPLTQAEKQYYSRLLDHDSPVAFHQRLWNGGEVNGQELQGEVFYVRVYGESGILSNGFMFNAR